MAGGDDRQDERSGRMSESEPEERTDLWMTTYSDMVTLLLTFFVLMFAISNVDNQKAMLFFAGMSRDGLSYEQYIEIMEITGNQPTHDPDGNLLPTPTPGVDAETDHGNPELDALQRLLTDYIEDNGLGDHIALLFNGEFLLLTLANDILFDTASAIVKPEMRDTAVVLARMLAETHNEKKPFEIIVAGHTDNVPIRTVRYPSNWHVSVDRATNFLEILIFESELDPSFFYARGCGEYRPIDTNDTAEGRQRNRRVEIMISLEREDERWGGFPQLTDN